jgi:hypothetical protein
VLQGPRSIALALVLVIAAGCEENPFASGAERLQLVERNVVLVTIGEELQVRAHGEPARLTFRTLHAEPGIPGRQVVDRAGSRITAVGPGTVRFAVSVRDVTEGVAIRFHATANVRWKLVRIPNE